LVALGVELSDGWSVVVERLIERLVEHVLRRLVRVCQHAHGGGAGTSSSDECPNAEMQIKHCNLHVQAVGQKGGVAQAHPGLAVLSRPCAMAGRGAVLTNSPRGVS
jgi:hypothetical protein